MDNQEALIGQRLVYYLGQAKHTQKQYDDMCIILSKALTIAPCVNINRLCRAVVSLFLIRGDTVFNEYDALSAETFLPHNDEE